MNSIIKHLLVQIILVVSVLTSWNAVNLSCTLADFAEAGEVSFDAIDDNSPPEYATVYSSVSIADIDFSPVNNHAYTLQLTDQGCCLTPIRAPPLSVFS